MKSDAVPLDISGAFLSEEHVLVALSGGVDSVALFLMLVALKDKGHIRLTAAHFDHRIREASARDAAFVEALCARHHVKLLSASEDVPARARAQQLGIETAAREARYAFLRAVMRDEACDVIALAHHMDDQAESVLMHMSRGSGITGIRGMSAREGDIVRPLLAYRKETLKAFVRSQGEAHCEDETNAQTDTPRNALRLSVIPALISVYPGAVEAISRLSGIAAREDDYMRVQAEAFIDQNACRYAFGIRLAIADAPHAVLARALLRLLPKINSATVSSILACASQGRGALSIARGLRAEVHGNALYIIDEGFSQEMAINPLADGVRLTGVGSLRVRDAQPVPITGDMSRQVLSTRALEGAVVRTRRPGDVIAPFGSDGHKKLSDYLIDKKVDRPIRDVLLIVADGREVLYVAGVGISERVRLKGAEAATELLFERERFSLLYGGTKTCTST